MCIKFAGLSFDTAPRAANAVVGYWFQNSTDRDILSADPAESAQDIFDEWEIPDDLTVGELEKAVAEYCGQ